MTQSNLFDDLVAVPGVQGAVLFEQKETPKLYWSDEAACQSPNDRFLRGAGQIVRRLCSTHTRVELRYQRGRFIVQSLGEGRAVACFTGRELNLPLLTLTLDELVQAFSAATADVSSSPVAASDRRVGSTGATANDALDQAFGLVQEGFSEPLTTHASVAAGLNDISLIATGYLGRSLVTGCWRQTQPAALQNVFGISPDGLIEAANELAAADAELVQVASEWARNFVAGCQLVRIDLPLQLVAPLNADAQALLAVGDTFGDRGLILLQQAHLRRLMAGGFQPPTEPTEVFLTHPPQAQAWADPASSQWNWEE